MAQSILVIDDSEDAHELIRIMLAHRGISIRSQFDGVTGLAAARICPPDLILLDVDMPAPDGFEVCRALKADPATADTPVIFLSGESGTNEKIRGLDLGAVDYVTKPFEPAELRARVGAALRTKELMDLLARSAMVDPLTGLWNRRYFDLRLESELASCARTGRLLSCIMLDIDHFKAVNDTYGHPGGDEVLRGVAHIIADDVRQGDLVVRMGGEEFAILTSDAHEEAAEALAERLRGRIADARFDHRGRVIRVTCSFGVASPVTVAAGTSADAPGVVDAADRSLYEAKRSGRNRVVSTNCLVA